MRNKRRIKRVTAGPINIQASYPAPPKRNDKTRAKKQKLSSEAQQRMNLKYAYEKLELELAANFVRGDLIATFTFDNEHLPDGRITATKFLKKFIRQLRRVRLLRGDATKYIYVTEDKHGGGRIHFHVVLNATGADYEEIQSLWPYGNVDFEQLIPDGEEKNYKSLAMYLTKEPREYGRAKPGQRTWASSKNLEKPEVDTMDVDENLDIVAPPGTIVLEEDGRRDQFGEWKYIKYYDRQGERPPAKAQK